MNENLGRFWSRRKRRYRSIFAARGCLAASGRCDFWSRFGHVLRRGARHTPVSQCQIERHGGVLQRLFCNVKKATFGICFAKYVTPAGGGQKHTPPLLCANNAKSTRCNFAACRKWRVVDQIGQSGQRSASSVSGTSTVSCQSVSYQASFCQLSLVSKEN